jgi:hypothetical protein
MFGGKKVTTKNGKSFTFLNPAQKGSKFAAELRDKIKYTNDGDVKIDKSGSCIGLSDTELAYRSGYLDSRKDSAKIYKYKKKKSIQ